MSPERVSVSDNDVLPTAQGRLWMTTYIITLSEVDTHFYSSSRIYLQGSL